MFLPLHRTVHLSTPPADTQSIHQTVHPANLLVDTPAFWHSTHPPDSPFIHLSSRHSTPHYFPPPLHRTLHPILQSMPSPCYWPESSNLNLSCDRVKATGSSAPVSGLRMSSFSCTDGSSTFCNQKVFLRYCENEIKWWICNNCTAMISVTFIQMSY